MSEKIKCPTSWNDIKLSQYLKFYKLVKPYEGTDEYAEKTLLNALFVFANVNADDYLNQSQTVILDLQQKISKLIGESNDIPVVKSFTLEDTEYGFIPSFDDMSYGEYLDLVSYSQKNMWDNMPIIMSILYRPINNKSLGMYSIEPYKGTTDDQIEIFKHALSMDIVFGALSFFLRLQEDLMTGTLTYLIQTLSKMKDPAISVVLEDLQKNGAGITQLQYLQTMISQNLKASHNSMSTSV